MEENENKKSIEELIMEYFTDVFKQKNLTKNKFTKFDRLIMESSLDNINSNTDDFYLNDKNSIIKNIIYDYINKYLEISDIICFSTPNDNFILHEDCEECEENNKVVGFSKNYSNEHTIKLNYINSDLPAYITFYGTKVYITGNIEAIENVSSDLYIINLKNKEKTKLCTFNGAFFANYDCKDIFYEKDRIFLIKKSDY